MIGGASVILVMVEAAGGSITLCLGGGYPPFVPPFVVAGVNMGIVGYHLRAASILGKARLRYVTVLTGQSTLIF
jgi:hypothetical protein